MPKCICIRMHQKRLPGARRPSWIKVGDIHEFDEVPIHFDALETALEHIDLMTAREDLLLSGRVKVEKIKAFMLTTFNIDLGSKQLKSSVKELIYARDNLSPVQRQAPIKRDQLDMDEMDAKTKYAPPNDGPKESKDENDLDDLEGLE